MTIVRWGGNLTNESRSHLLKDDIRQYACRFISNNERWIDIVYRTIFREVFFLPPPPLPSLPSGTNKFPLIKGCDISTWNRIGNRCIVTDVSSLFQVFLYSLPENAFSSDAILCEILHVRAARSTFPSNFPWKSLPGWFFPRVFNGWEESQIYMGLSTIKNKNDLEQLKEIDH